MTRSSAIAMTAVLLAFNATSGIAHAVAAQAADATESELLPEDFAYGVKALISGDAAACRAALPLSVYQKVIRGDLGDVRIFNERNEMVPYRIERPSAESAVQGPPVSLPLFTLRDDSRESLEAVRVTIESGGTRVGVATPKALSPSTTESGSSRPVASYILDGRALRSPVATFQLSWPDNAPDFAGRLRIEASEDLGSWQTVVTGAPIANLRAGNARIVERSVELAGVSAKFWRLSWADASAPFEVTSVVAEPAHERVDVPRPSLAVDGKPVVGKSGEFEFDLGARVPADRVNLELPEQNSIVAAELLSRAAPDQPWRHVASGGFYRLKSTRPVETGGATVETNADLTNGSLVVAPSSDRYWLARVDVRNGGLGRGTPKLRVGWVPHDVVFLARGTGPFTLAYGSSKARPTAALGAIPGSVSIVKAHFSEPELLGGDTRLLPVPEKRSFWSKSVILWTVLGVAVALLALMAYRLARELK